MTKKRSPTGFSILTIILILLVVVMLAVSGFALWQKGRERRSPNKQSAQVNEGTQQMASSDKTTNWTLLTTEGGAFSIRVPDGWSLTAYPGDFIGSPDIQHYQAGSRATIARADSSYAGDSLRFRASITPLDDAGLGPQWSSPQPGLQESTTDFAIGSIHGKRYTGVFSGDLNQTLYEYVFDVGSGKKLDIVYTVYHKKGDQADVDTVEKAIRTIVLY